MKKALVFVLALILLVGVFAACGPNVETPTTTGSKPAATTTAPKGDETTTAPKGQSTATTEGVTTTDPVPTQPDLDMTAPDKDPVPGEDYSGSGVQLPWMPF